MKKFCCQGMEDAIIKYKAINLEEEMRNYLLSVPYKNGNISLALGFCPFCGQDLGKSLNSEYYDILYEEYRIEYPETIEANKVPPEFKTDEWWRKRGL